VPGAHFYHRAPFPPRRGSARAPHGGQFSCFRPCSCFAALLLDIPNGFWFWPLLGGALGFKLGGGPLLYANRCLSMDYRACCQLLLNCLAPPLRPAKRRLLAPQARHRLAICSPPPPSCCPAVTYYKHLKVRLHPWKHGKPAPGTIHTPTMRSRLRNTRHRAPTPER
jgi:hypothetical protein